MAVTTVEVVKKGFKGSKVQKVSSRQKAVHRTT